MNPLKTKALRPRVLAVSLTLASFLASQPAAALNASTEPAKLVGQTGTESKIDVQHVVSPGGIEAWLVEEHSIPILSFNFGFEGGAFLDKPGKEGTSNYLSGVLDEGAGSRDSQTFRAALEENSIALSFSADRDAFYGSVQTLIVNKDLAFELVKESLTSPRFDKEPLDRIRNQIEVGLKRREMNPNALASKALFKALYGDHPYGRQTQGTVDTLKGIKKSDLQNYMKRGLTKDRLKVGVVGDIDAAGLAVLLDEVFGDLPESGDPINVEKVSATAEGSTIVIDQQNPQSTVIFAGPSVMRGDPDFIPTYVLNYTLGGGSFSSRLLHEVREKRGLTYSIYTYSFPLERSALYVGQVASDNAKIAETLAITKAEFEKMREHGVTAQELEDAKRYLTGAFPLRFTSNSSISAQLIGYQMAGYDIEYINQRNAKINAVTLEDVARAAKRLPSPDEMTFVIVGQPQGIDQEP